jgi:curved DNA-binding protein CbpA
MDAKPDKDYYDVLGVEESATRAEIDRQYKRLASKHHPDLGGSEERMKSLNEAYGVLKDHSLRTDYDRGRRYSIPVRETFVPRTKPTAQDVGLFGHVFSSLLCLIAGFFLLVLVRFQWIWFLWPLAILAVFVLGFGVLMARSAMKAANASLPTNSRLKRHSRLQEIVFWTVIASGAYGLYLLME